MEVERKMFQSVLLALIIGYFGCLCDELPSFIHVCHKEDPQLEQCLMASVEDIRPFLVDGVPEYNLPQMEPLIIKDLFSEETAGMKITVSNVSAWGCTDFFVRNIEVNLDTNEFVLYVDLPKLRIEAHYSVDGKLVLVPVKGDGNLEANITDAHAKAMLKGDLYEKDGDEYLKYNTFDLHVEVGGGSVRLENLFNGDKILLGMINDVVNKNFDAFVKELMPVIEKGLACKFKETANAIVESFTYKQLFPH
ncbi:unnamed protein product [Callosobruchus maculatus]|uniref:Uncharacterized protein n=1 Tax=Callosobruchus maculatus TaxID=64391 RepID=A0A653DX27_CALMS|nr:unnamed protein product [Callosobruchus maculatus]